MKHTLGLAVMASLMLAVPQVAMTTIRPPPLTGPNR
jgi:hypothetical protein